MVEISQGDYRVYMSSDSIYLQHLSYSRVLVIEKFSSNVYEADQEILNKIVIYGAAKPHAILGIMKLGSIDFLVYVKNCQPVGFIEEAEVFKIKDVELIPIADDTTVSNLTSEIKSLINGIKNLLALGFFYSFHYDLTNSRQKQVKNKSNSVFESAEKKFFWNINLYKKFLNIEKKSLSKIWMVVCICGYVGIASQTVDSHQVSLILISRRSVNHAGTRYNTRGIDDEGHVANYCETEQMIKILNFTLSFVQVRGSAPVFFQQTGMTAQTQITRIPEMGAPGFLRHVEEIQKDFQMIFFVNLMNTNKPGEQIITQNMENQIRDNILKSCRYYFFDFQNECKYDNYDKIDSFISYMESIFNIFKFYCEDTNSGQINKEQSGIIRTNCLDCLDRTNVIQTKIAWKILEIQLSSLNVDISNIFKENFFNPKNKVHPLMENFKDLWADNGDFISVQYAGTASTITTITKNGKHGFFGLFQHGLVSLTRFYQGSFEDNFKQKCIETLLQKFNSDNSQSSDPIIEEELRKCEHKFTSNEDLLVYIGTWNVGGREPKDGTMLFEWLCPMKDLKQPDIYIIGFQEIVDLNAKNIVLASNSSKVEFWKKLIQKHLNEVGHYVIIKVLDLVGILSIVLVKESIKENIKNIESQIVRTGLLGTMGNKGSCLLRFNYHDTSFSISTCHLSAGGSNVSARVTEINEILNKTYNYKNLRYKDHDVQFLFGDLNFRIDLDITTCRQMISSGSLSSLSSYDQLNKAKSVSTTLIEMDEGPLNFDPTYKYLMGTSEYDLKKKRVPSWCDRILFKKNSNIEVIDYNRVDYLISDHKPVYGLFNISTTKIDQVIRNDIIREISSQQNNEVNLLNNNNGFNDITSHIDDEFFNINKFNKNTENVNDEMNDLNITDGDEYIESSSKNSKLAFNMQNQIKIRKKGLSIIFSKFLNKEVVYLFTIFFNLFNMMNFDEGILFLEFLSKHKQKDIIIAELLSLNSKENAGLGVQNSLKINKNRCNLKKKREISEKKLKFNNKTKISFNCNCGKKYTTKENLVFHIMNKHDNQKPFKCKFCEVKFSHRNGQTYHERRFHINYLPYRCTIHDCERQFAQKSALGSHIKNQHRG